MTSRASYDPPAVRPPVGARNGKMAQRTLHFPRVPQFQSAEEADQWMLENGDPIRTWSAVCYYDHMACSDCRMPFCQHSCHRD